MNYTIRHLFSLFLLNLTLVCTINYRSSNSLVRDVGCSLLRKSNIFSLHGKIIWFTCSRVDFKRCYYLSIAQIFALLEKLIKKSVTRWRYFLVARAPKPIRTKKERALLGQLVRQKNQELLDTETAPSTQKYRHGKKLR